MAIKLGFWIINAQIIALLFLANLHQQSVSAKDKDKGAKDKVDEKIKVYFFPATTEYKVNVYLHDKLETAHKDLVASKFDDARAGTFFTLTQPDGRQVLTLLKEKLSGKYVILHFQSTSEDFKKNLLNHQLTNKKLLSPVDVDKEELAFTFG
ncbi:hypothetical protein GPALN_010898 [Globodera pallida]|nr:hypothetical protein GPALN_010898 [Globodera pallida]